ncbi:MAG: hypothetical protein JNM10_12165, partial [Planctomycetia bacterium]|nr:hypothetical protein [Planctomycetia bacterium]
FVTVAGDGGTAEAAPAGGVGAAAVTLRARGGRAPGLAYPTARVPLERRYDVRPARPPTEAPPPAPPPAEDVGARWLRRLLALAGGLLGVDLLLGALRKKFVAGPSRRA